MREVRRAAAEPELEARVPNDLEVRVIAMPLGMLSTLGKLVEDALGRCSVCGDPKAAIAVDPEACGACLACAVAWLMPLPCLNAQRRWAQELRKRYRGGTRRPPSSGRYR